MNKFSREVSDKKIVYLSPHLDDLAFSNGGLIQKIGKKNFTLVNIFNKSSFAPNLTGKVSISKIRTEEDRSFCKKMKCRKIDLGFNDSSLRNYRKYFVSQEQASKNIIFDFVTNKVLDAISLLEPDYIFCPLAIGNHIDHQIIFLSVKKSRHKLISKVFFYEDLPYAGEISKTKLIREIMIKIESPKSIPFPLTSAEIKNKLSSLLLYKSQIESCDINSTFSYAKSLIKNKYAERLWVENE